MHFDENPFTRQREKKTERVIMISYCYWFVFQSGIMTYDGVNTDDRFPLDLEAWDGSG